MAKASELLQEFRAKHDLTQQELGYALNMARWRTINDWEKERTEPPPFLSLALDQLALLFATRQGFRAKVKLNAKDA